jgi:cardiolipin synthase
MKIYAKKTFGDYIKCQEEIFNSGALVFNDKNVVSYKDMIKMNLFTNKASYTQNNDVEIFVDGKEKFHELLKCIEEAKNNIHIEYYIIKNDNLGNRLMSLLEKKAEEGVEVRLMFDSLGGRSITKERIDKLKKSGVKVASFFSSSIPFFNFK